MAKTCKLTQHFEEFQVSYTPEEVEKIIENYTRVEYNLKDGNTTVDLNELRIYPSTIHREPIVRVRIRKTLP